MTSLHESAIRRLADEQSPLGSAARAFLEEFAAAVSRAEMAEARLAQQEARQTTGGIPGLVSPVVDVDPRVGAA